MSADPLVSIVTVVRNHAQGMCVTLESLRQQDYPAIEHIVIDGASEDGTLDVLQQAQGQITHLVSEPDRGIYDAMNKGVSLARGPLLMHLNAGDRFAAPDALRTLVQAIEQAGADTAFSDLVYRGLEDGARVSRIYGAQRWTPAALKKGWMPPHPTWLVRRNSLLRWGPYSLEYTIASDFDMMLRAYLLHRASFVYVPQVTVEMEPGGISSQGVRSFLRARRECCDALRRNGFKAGPFSLWSKVPAKIWERARCL
ncbi:glycosyltransferase family 2 protein [Thioalkalivibrio sp. ALJT]|uniref:glycosyltransferase family 2 protein n=1 Tax=Thioalkalivibrio sp. ALJT TaxID=1158146 RepID=UPI000378CBED|nr:glycosyltransferase family 2 protein [Thioalkalivibrio sp. ALJT]